MAQESPDLTRRRSRGPKPPADYGTDSAEVASPQTPGETEKEKKTRPPRKEPVIQLNTRIALSYRDLIDDVAAREGLSIRAIIEKALDNTYRGR